MILVTSKACPSSSDGLRFIGFGSEEEEGEGRGWRRNRRDPNSTGRKGGSPISDFKGKDPDERRGLP